MVKFILGSIIALLVVLMPLLLALVPNVRKIKLEASKKGYSVTIEKYPTMKKKRRLP